MMSRMVSAETGAAERLGRRFVVAAALVTVVPWLLMLASTQAATPGEGVSLTVLAVWLGIPHVAATAVFYADREMRPMMTGPRYSLVPALAVAVSVWLSTAGHAEVLLLVNVLWTAHHFAKQNVGMVAFTARAAGVPGPSPLDRRVIAATGVAGMLGYSSVLVAELGWGLDTRPLEGAGIAVLAVCAVLSWRSPCRVLMCAAVVFFLPLYLGIGVIPGAIAYTAAHGAQYLLMVGKIAAPSPRLLGVLAGSLLVGGWGLNHGSSHTGWVYGAAIGATFAHFVIDAGVWKMSQPEKRAYMRERFAFL